MNQNSLTSYLSLIKQSNVLHCDLSDHELLYGCAVMCSAFSQAAKFKPLSTHSFRNYKNLHHDAFCVELDSFIGGHFL